MVVFSCSGNTTNFRVHLRTNHVTNYVEIEKLQNAEVAEKKSRQSTSSNAGRHKPNEKQQTLLQVRLPGSASSSSKFEAEHPKQKMMTNKIAFMIAKDMQPYSIVEDPGFRDLISCAEPRFVMPARKTVSKDIIPKLHAETFNRVKNELSKAKSVAMTTDAWTSRANQGYLAYTAHLVDRDFQPKNYCLQVENSSESHSSANLATSLSNCVTTWTTEEQRMGYLKVVAVSDNASNIQTAISKLPHLCTPLNCFDHTLQLAINDAVKDCVQVKETIAKAKAITCHFKHSTKNTKRLLELEKQNGLPQLKLKQECPTRWNSRYDMLDRLVTVKGAVSAIVASVKTAPSLSAAEWEIADEYVKMLKPFKVATAKMSAAKYPTISMVIPELNNLKYSLSNETCQFDCLPTLKEDLLANIDRRWPGYETKPVYAASTILDPRYKDCGFNEASAASYGRDLVLREMILDMGKKAAETPIHCDSDEIQTGMAYISGFLTISYSYIYIQRRGLAWGTRGHRV
jgi:hypothetical protein